MKHKKLLFITILFLFCAILIGWKSVSYKNDSDTSETKESMQSRIKKIYNVENQSKIASSLNKEKLNPTYAEDNMFVKYNPYGTNTQSLYVYFTTEDAVKVSYTVHVDDSVISDFTRNVAQSSTYQTTHEFQLIGLIPNSINEIMITLTKKDGSSVKKTMNYELDWMHINTIQYTKDDSLILSSRETSSIIKLKNISSAPEIDYMIGDFSFRKNTGYENLLYTKKGDFTIQGGQHTVTYEEDSSLKDSQYYLYMYNNNIGISETRSDFDWSSIGLTNSKPYKGTTSYYYKYLVDEKKHTFELVDSFKVPYSGYVSSVQKIGNNTVIDSGLKSIFSEYDSDHKKIASFKMNIEKYIYRVYKYDFDGFYFSS